ncbi:MAG TPA: alpha/beta hydrolase, partial [Ancylobacter sp.]
WQREREGAAEMQARRSRRAMTIRAKGFAELASWALGPSATVRFAVMPDEDHASILPVAMTRALRFVLG